MKLALILPRNMHFGPHGASAIDLCVRNYARFSAHADGISVFARRVDDPFTDVNVHLFDPPVPPLSWLGQVGCERPLARMAPDAIFVAQYAPAALHLAAAFPHIPVILGRHGYWKPNQPAPKRAARARKLRRLAGVVAVSDSVRDQLIECDHGLADRVLTVYNGLDIDRWPMATGKERLIGFVGRCVPEKGVVEAAEAVAALLAEKPDWRAVFICSTRGADTMCLERLRALKTQAGERFTVAFDQDHDAVQDLFHRSAIALVPSVWQEPFGLTAIEAMASGCCLITSGHGGLSEIATPETSLLVPDPTAARLGEALRSAVDDDDLRTRLGHAARNRVEALFDIRAVSAQLDAVLARLSSNGPANRPAMKDCR